MGFKGRGEVGDLWHRQCHHRIYITNGHRLPEAVIKVVRFHPRSDMALGLLRRWQYRTATARMYQNPITKRISMIQRPSSPQESAQIETLIASLNRSMELLSSDIEVEEKRARVHDVSDPAYPSLARQLRSRRAKLRETIAALRSRLENARNELQNLVDSAELQDS